MTAAYDGTTKTATHTVTIAAKGASVENEITGLELVPPTSSVACDGQVTLTPKVTYTGNLTESDFTVTWEITEGSDYAELVVPSARARGELTFTGGNTRILQAKNGTNSEQTVTVSVTVSAGEKSLTKECTVTVGAASTTENRIWTWNPSYAAAVAAVSSDTDIKDSENDTSVTLISGAAISESSLTDSEGATYSNALYFNGGGSKAFKAVKFAVDGACKISVVARSSGDSERSLILSDGSNELATFPAVLKSATPAPQSYDYTGGSGTLYLYSKSGGINVYLIQAVYGSSSSSSVTTVTISGNQSVVVGNSVTLTATPNATATGAYTWEITAGAGSVTLDSSTTNKVTVTGKAAGTAKITAAVDGVTSVPYTVTVRDPSEAGADLVVTPGAQVTTNGWADLANDGAGMSYPDTTNIIYIGDNGYQVGSGSLTAYTTTMTKRKVFTNAIASGSVSSSSVNETAAIIVLSGMVDLSDGKVSNTDHSYFDEFDSSTHKREHDDIVYEIGSNKAIIGVNSAQVAFGGLQIYANKCERGNIIIQNIDFWDAHGSTEEDTSHNSKSKASADSLVLESNGSTTVNNQITYNYVPKNIWIDHCKFSDGTCTDLERNFNHDGSLDMKAGQYVTVSYCEFTNHDKVTLLAPNDNYVAPEQRQITFHHNYYHGAIQRMPRSRGCQVHIYNNYYNEIGIEANGGYSLGPGIGSQFIVENNYFDKHQTKKILKYFDTSKDGSSAATFSRLYQSGNNVTFTSDNMATDGDTAASVTDHLTYTAPWTINYSYKNEMSANAELPALIPNAAGTDKQDYTKTVEVNGVLY